MLFDLATAAPELGLLLLDHVLQSSYELGLLARSGSGKRVVALEDAVLDLELGPLRRQLLLQPAARLFTLLQLDADAVA